MAILIATLLSFSMTASMMLIPSAHAQGNLVTYAYINVAPNPTGLGQRVEIIMWVEPVFGNNAELINNYRFSEGTASDPSWTLVITAPDGTKTTETLGVVSSTTSDYDYYYTPTAVGTYVFTFNFPATTVTASYDPTSAFVGDTYLAATASTNLTVQSAPISALPSTPLPTAFWMRPIYGENTAWYTIGSNWLGWGSPNYVGIAVSLAGGANGESFGTPFTQVGSLTPHIMWNMPLAPGGIVGQTATAIVANSYGDGSAYDQKFQNPIIVDGLLIFTEPISQCEPNSGPTVCYNLETGKQMWSENIPYGSAFGSAISFAYVYDAEDGNQHGVWPPMLVASTFTSSFQTEWLFYDAFTGAQLFSVNNIPSFQVTMLGPNGEYLGLNLVNYGTSTTPNWYLQEWNSSRLWDNLYSGPSTTPNIPPPISNGAIACNAAGVPNNQTVDATWTGGYVLYPSFFGLVPTYVGSLYDFNVSVPWLNSATLNGAAIGSITETGAIQGDMLLAYAGTLPQNGDFDFLPVPSYTPYEWFGINLNSTTGTLGAELWHNTLPAPAGNFTVIWGGMDPSTNVFVEDYRETNQFVGFSLLTGQQIWGPTAPLAALDYYGSTASGTISDTLANGQLYACGYAGIVYSFDDTTGKILWTYGNGPVGSDNSTNSGLETPFGVYPIFINAIGSGVVYTVTTEHTEETPIFKGAVATAINATTGALIWKISDYVGQFFTTSYAMADGYNAMFNSYDNSIQIVGRGPSETTVTAPDVGVTTATPITITGTVMDISAGTTQAEQAADFPHGVPCASDASMSAWMSYVYQQQPEPTNFTGVPVTISVTDSNHNTYIIGTATTDETGTYSLTWTPGIPGNFTVTASFSGTNGYYPSSAETTFNMMSAPPTTAPTASPPSGLASTGTVELGVVAIIIVIIIIGALILVMLSRKRP
ncbi:MAG TPA: PQQ-binding-like beta-propeller repeat protein [Candidatus Limnocylindrales bacterium]|nr:PQQ-binding-like beta-propeller repeat protein [Candidatus Limnocylindrales bacterium]